MSGSLPLDAATAVLRCYSGSPDAVVVPAGESADPLPRNEEPAGIPTAARLSVVDGEPRLTFDREIPAELARCLHEDLIATVAGTPLTEPATERLGRPAAEPAGTVEASIPELFWDQVDRHPKRPAVLDHGRPVSYRTLGERVAGLATLLDEVQAGQRVGLLLDHGIDTIAGMLATLTIGAVYVPLDPRYPMPRLAAMTEQARVSTILTTQAHRALADQLATPDTDFRDIAAAPKRAPRPDRPLPDPQAPAYILHTSGSTGRPKGVVQRHRNVLHQIRLHRANLALTPDDRISVVSSFSFDMAVTDTFAALLTGACCVPVDVRALGLAGLAEALRRDRVTIYHSTPTVFRYLTDCLDDAVLADLRVVLLGGEAVTVADLDRCRRHLPHGVLVNGYGATEISFAVQNHLPLAETAPEETVVPIGRPLAGVRIGLLAPDGSPAAVVGEVAISSDFLADYWADPWESAARFDHDHAGVRRYRTGDLARRLPDGRLVYLGRKDRQIKVRGHRVEPGEVEVALGEVPSVTRAAVLADHRDHEMVLRAFVTGVDVEPEAVRAAVARVLPDYLVPATVDVVAELPLTPTGKVDATELLARHPLPPAVIVIATSSDDLTSVVVTAWAEVLGRSDIGANDRFFDIGGHSLLAATVHHKLRSRLDRDFPLTAIYEHPTVSELVAYLQTGARHTSTARITARMARRQSARARRRS
ncbi:MAG TPA: non-ribosomal peptide synthetase [Actinophytocola sp.]|nr:non-ribosomal peptide synthetase [Actinophytocola sp.]